MDNYFKIDVAKELKEMVEADATQADLLARWKKLELTDLEEYLLIAVFPPFVDDWDASLKKYEDELPFLRGLNDSVTYWFTSDQLHKMEFSDTFLSSEETRASFLASLKLWYIGDYTETVKELFRNFEKYTNGTFTFNDLEDELSSFYIRATLLLIVRYFDEFPLTWQGYLLNSDFFHLAIMMNLDIDSAFRRAISFPVLIYDRRDFAVQYATFIYDNKSPVGVKPDGSEITNNAFWIDLFRQFSKQTFDGISLINFLNDKEIWQNCDIEDKMVIKEVLVLYSHLILDTYVLPPADEIEKFEKQKEKSANLKSSTKPAIDYKKIKQEIETRFPKNKDGEYEDVSGIFEALGAKAEESGDEKIAELFFWDETEGKFRWGI